MGVFSKIREGLQKTRDAMVQSMQRVVNSFTKIDEELFEQLEETMIMGDMGVDTSVEICERLRRLVKERGVKDPAQIMDLIEEIIGDMMGTDVELNLSTKPSVIMVIGVNGAGKTTTIGKLCHQFKEDGKKVLVAAADTFRAAAIDQLEVWTQRAGVDIVKHSEGSDPASVVFDGISAAIARQCDVVIVDTAGRLHNKKNLMEELAKINRILSQKAEGCAIETLLVLDATTGQNAVSQAKLFSEVANITGIVLTKLDGTAKGGIVVSIKNELGIPVKLVGVGEKIEDLQTFDSRDFVRALFDRQPDEESTDEEISAEEEVISEEEAVVEEEAATVEEAAIEEEAASEEEIAPEEVDEAEEEASEAIVSEPEKPKKKKWWSFGRKEEENDAGEEAASEEDEAPVEEVAPVEETPSEEEIIPEEEPAPVEESVSEEAPVLEELTEEEEEASEAEEASSEEEDTPEPEKPKKKKWWQFGKKKED